jgi:F0F1-type ATP synthase membrane subunit b/b'
MRKLPAMTVRPALTPIVPQDFSSFLKERSNVEDEHAKKLRRMCKTTFQNIRSGDSRQGSYAQQFEAVTNLHERMADNGLQFSLNLHQMHEDLNQLAYEMEKGRKHWKTTGLNAEQRVQDAERQLDKAKQKYDSLAEDYDHAKTGDKASGRHFGLRGPKSGAQYEEDLLKKLQIADKDYQSKVQVAQQERQQLISSARPQAIKSMQELISECDAGLALQFQKFGMFNAPFQHDYANNVRSCVQ